MTVLATTALELHAAGLSVVPVAADGTKRPRVAWKNYTENPAGTDQIESWFTDQVDQGIGIVTGFGDVEMLEVEGKAMGMMVDVVELLDGTGLRALYDQLVAGWSEQSPSGGLHLFYRLAGGNVPGNTKVAQRPLDVAPGRETLAETRGTGGFVVLAPSAGGVHPTGRPWIRLTGGPGTLPMITREERDALHAVLHAGLDTMPDEQPAPAGPVDAKWSTTYQTAAGDVTPGDDYERRTEWAEILLGWTHVFTRGTTKYWRRPGKNDGISATTGHAGDRDRLYVFTSSTEFNPEVPYTKFGAYCVAPETKVLRADLTWTAAGDLVPGDALVGVDETIESRAGRRKLRLSHVESAERRTLPCYRIRLSDSRELIASDEHPWLAASAGGGGNMRWIETRNLRPGQRICAITNGTWDTATDFDSGWLAGILDGEGWASGGVVGIAQKPGPVFDRAHRLLRERGFTPAVHKRSSGVNNLKVATLSDTLRLLGTLQPQRLLSKLDWVGRGAWTQAAPNAIVESVEFIGDRETAAFMTTTRTFIAEGLVTHNTLLNHRGDHAAAAKALAESGHGHRAPRELAARTTSTGTQLAAVGNTAPAPAAVIGSDQADLTDDGNARLLVAEYSGTLRYVPDAGKWVTWEGSRWAWHPDDGPAIEAARDVIRRIPTDNPALASHRLRSMRARAIGDATRLARSAPAMRIPASLFDRHPWQLNTPGGVVDLRTGAIAAATPALFHSKQTTVTPDAGMRTPLWDQFLKTTFQGNVPLERYVQQLAGLTFIGEVLEHVLPFAHGPGGNGKGVFAEVLLGIAGDYGASAPQGFLLAGRDKHETELANLQGRRVVVASEINENTRFDEAKVKALTGGDTITARYMRQDFFSFTPSHTFWLLGNNQPKVETGGNSFWRRLRLIPFTHIIPDAEKIENLQQRLVDDEGPGILAWIVAGAVRYAAEGLGTPQSVLAATDTYRAEEDHLGRFVEERCAVGGGDTVRVEMGELRRAYDAWCKEQRETELSAQAFGRQLRQRFDVGANKSNGRKYYTNITLYAPESPAAAEDPRDQSWWDR